MSEVAVNTPPVASSESSSTGGFLTGIKKESAPVASIAPDPIATDTWMWDEGRPGEGPRPSWLDAKYRSVADKARAHTEAEKKLGQLGSAPENYDFGELQDRLDTTNPHLQKFMETAKKNRLPQDTFQEMVGTLIEYEQSKLPNKDIEIQKLGANAHERIETVRRWAASNLSEEACNTLGQIGDRAEVIKFVDELRQLTLQGQSVPPGSSEAGSNYVVLTQEDIDAELAVPANAQRYLNDAKYRAEISNKLKIIYGED